MPVVGDRFQAQQQLQQQQAIIEEEKQESLYRPKEGRVVTDTSRKEEKTLTEEAQPTRGGHGRGARNKGHDAQPQYRVKGTGGDEEPTEK